MPRVLILHASVGTGHERAATALAAAFARKADSVKGQARQQFLAQAELASAEAYFYEGQLRLAKEQAKRAKAGLANGSPNWIKADDILTFQIPTTN